MFTVQALTTFLALAAPLLVRADVTPSEPGPGSSFNVGSTCHLTWEGDKESTTAWKDMAIELMAGSNLGMVHLTTVATAQDGTVDGKFDYPCPDVNPYSTIYFYQFSSPHTTVKTWTTRFTIASSSGATTPPANAVQPGKGDPIPWGVGALADPSKAVAAPAFGGGAADGTTAGNSTTGTGSTTGSPTTPAPVPTNTASKLVVTKTSSSSSSANTSSTNSSSSSSGGAVSSVAVDIRVWMTAAGILTFAALL